MHCYLRSSHPFGNLPENALGQDHGSAENDVMERSSNRLNGTCVSIRHHVVNKSFFLNKYSASERRFTPFLRPV